MNRLPEGASKAQELEHWQAFVNALPKCSYLALYLAGSDDLLRHAMQIDMSCELVADIQKARNYARAEHSLAVKAWDDAKAKRDAMVREVNDLMRAATRARDELRDAMKAAQTLAVQTLAVQTNDAYNRAVQSVVQMSK